MIVQKIGNPRQASSKATRIGPLLAYVREPEREARRDGPTRSRLRFARTLPLAHSFDFAPIRD